MTAREKLPFRWRRFPPTQFLIYVFIRTLVAVLEMLPDGLALRAGKFVGRLFYLLDAKHRNIGVKNLQRAEGMPKDPAEIHRLIRRVYEHFGVSLAEILLIPRMVARGELSQRVKLEGREHLDRALEEGRGAIIIVPHMGNWELAAMAVAAGGYKVNSVSRPIENPWLHEYFTPRRQATGHKLVFREGAIGAIREVLGRNEVIAIMPDQNAHEKGVFVPFFGRPASTGRTPALMAIKSGAPIIPAKSWRCGRLEHKVVFTPPLRPAPGVPLEEAVTRLTAEMTARIEEWVRERPEQWMWLHARWKTKPPAERVEAEATSAP